MAVHNAVCSVPATSFYLVPGGPEGRADRAVGSLRCTFDGETMSVVGSGNELRNTTEEGWKGDTLLARVRWTRPNYELSWKEYL